MSAEWFGPGGPGEAGWFAGSRESRESGGSSAERLRPRFDAAMQSRGEASASVRAGGARLRQGYGGSAAARQNITASGSWRAPAPVKKSQSGGLAAVFAAFYPYYIVHDTALQDTGLFTAVTLISVLLLIRARRTRSGAVAACAGSALAVAVLTRSTIAPIALLAPVWLYFSRSFEPRAKAPGAGTPPARLALICAAVLIIGVTPWLVRSYALTGSVVLESDSGARLWDGNNQYTFTRYPVESIDLSKKEAIEALSPGELADLGAAGSNEVAIDRWFMHRALAYMREHPWLTVVNGFRKIGAAFSVLPSPRRSLWPTLAYSLSYGPIMILGLCGMISCWRSWRQHVLIYWLFFSFAVVTAVVFGHTSHRAFLDVYWMAYAASLIATCLPKTTMVESGL